MEKQENKNKSPISYLSEQDVVEEKQQILYPERTLSEGESKEQDAHIDLSYAGLSVDVANIGELEGDGYALARRYGLGTSDSSIVLGVNPFKTRSELIKEKATDTLTEEERGISKLTAVRKGVDLEPLIIDKRTRYFKEMTWKPKDMYKNNDFPWLKYNFDGISGTPGAYYPVEIKVVTARGEKHYNFAKASFDEDLGFLPPPQNITASNNSIQTKAAHYGIPPYYYTQLQQEIMGCASQYGWLTVLAEKDWKMYSFFVHRDEKVISSLIVESHSVWKKVVALNPQRGEGMDGF